MSVTPAITTAIALTVIALGLVRTAVDKRPRARGVFDALGKIEVWAITTLLAVLMLLGATQIVLRNVAHTGILWADPLMRHIVLWLGCLGGTLATARVRHINIDVFSRALDGRARIARDVIVHAATAAAAFVLGVAALRLVVDERAFGDAAFMGLETWMLQTILPFAFFVVSYRSIVNLLLRRRPQLEGEEG